jgi:hypothetical protein
VIGTEWDSAAVGGGYDGIESEGLCYVAKVVGYTCWGLTRDIAVHA